MLSERLRHLPDPVYPDGSVIRWESDVEMALITFSHWRECGATPLLLGRGVHLDSGRRASMTDFVRMRQVKATRKAHVCMAGNHEIPAGSPAQYGVGMIEYQFTTYYLCARGWACACEPETNHQDVPQTDDYPF
jgi:hypothetical protein